MVEKSSSSFTDVNLYNGFIAYYPFNEDVKDAGANKQEGALYEGVGF
jgi:hypothetical protein